LVLTEVQLQVSEILHAHDVKKILHLKNCIMEFCTATSAWLAMFMQTFPHDACEMKVSLNLQKRVTHLWPTESSRANILDPLSRRCAKLNHCQPTSLSFKWY